MSHSIQSKEPHVSWDLCIIILLMSVSQWISLFYPDWAVAVLTSLLSIKISYNEGITWWELFNE